MGALTKETAATRNAAAQATAARGGTAQAATSQAAAARGGTAQATAAQSAPTQSVASCMHLSPAYSSWELHALFGEPTEVTPDMLAPFLELLRRYYAGAFTASAQPAWPLFAIFAEEPLAERDPVIAQIVCRIAQASAEDARTFPYEFNRLFVGPDRLVAPPYETVYTSTNRTLMQLVTLAVRESYRSAGFEPLLLNVQPDDHMALELAFLGELLEHEGEEAHVAFQAFMREHLGLWYRAHVEGVRAHTSNDICRAFADLLELTCLWSERY